MALSSSTLTGFFALLAIVGRVMFHVITPIWVDYFNIHTHPLLNITNNTHNNTPYIPIYPGYPVSHNTNIIFVVVGQYAFSTIIVGAALLAVLLFRPAAITQYDRSYPKKNFFLIGFAQGVSSILINFAVSGSRTAPYLQAVLSNFGIPIQFVVRFLLLRKRPTCLKTICACLVVLSEFVCLLPTIFPSLESAKQEQAEGGATGAGRVLWPICMVMSMVPYAVANSIMERSVQDSESSGTESLIKEEEKDEKRKHQQQQQVHLVYFLFWWCFFNTLTVAGLFWVDFIPGFGTSSNIVEFGHKLIFNIKCLFGGTGCGVEVATLGWLTFLSNLIGAVAFAGLMRYSEGASFVVIVLAMRTPVLFLFWTLFQEQPFQWSPHVALSTWLSTGAIFVMLPAIVVYNLGLPRVSRCQEVNDDQENQQLIHEENSDLRDHSIHGAHSNVHGHEEHSNVQNRSVQ